MNPIPVSSPDRSGEPAFALALGGGGARGLVHIHVIQALNELGVVPTAIAGTSIGAIMGAAFAAGMSGKDIERYTRGIFMRRAEIMNRMWSMRPDSISQMVGGLKVTQFSIERILHAFLPEAIPQSFDELKIPLSVVATDYYGHHAAAFSDGDLRFALAASAALPAVFAPVIRGGRTYIDGGMSNPVPFDLLHGKADMVIAVDVVGHPEEIPGRKPGSIDLMFGASQLLMQSIITHKLERHPPAILLRPPVSGYRVLDFLKVDMLLSATKPLKDELKRAIEQAMKVREEAQGPRAIAEAPWRQ